MVEFWEGVGNRPYGCTGTQVEFVKAMLDGLSGWKAAKAAGYQGDSVGALAAAATRAKQNPKVQQLYEAALQFAKSHTGDIAAPDELLKLLTKTARHGQNENARTRAQELLAKNFTQLSGQRPGRVTQAELLTLLSNNHPAMMACAVIYADRFHSDPEIANWRPPSDRVQLLTDNYPELGEILRSVGCGHFLSESVLE